jgi:hypothetical protein
MPIGGGGERAQRNAGRIHSQGALEALFAPSRGAAPSHLAATRSLREAAVDGEIVQRQADHPIIGAKYQIQECSHHASGDPFIPPAA